MKLRNKETGEIWDIGKVLTNDYPSYESLKQINADWEDYEEDELLYVISAEHKSGYQCVLKEEYPEICKVAKELGVGFETEKECRKAVEKLKAWKRLKDKGFKFNKWITRVLGVLQIDVCFDEYNGISPEDKKDLDLLFGGEE